MIAMHSCLAATRRGALFAIVIGVLAALVYADDTTDAAPTKHTFAVIGDFGNDSDNQAAVVNMIKSTLKPDFIVTVGDNNYGALTHEGYDLAVGKYFHEFIGNYTGEHGQGAAENKFFPAIGNHDWHRNTEYQGFTEYFTLPGNERYYDFTIGEAHFIIINSDSHEPDGREPGSVQYQWCKDVMTKSDAKWTFVFLHHPPYSSSTKHGSTQVMRWPFGEWGATAVFAGHDHTYERFEIEGTPYFITGLGGMSRYEFGDRLPQTQERHNDTFGAMKVVFDDNEVTFEFWSVKHDGTKLDALTVKAPRNDEADTSDQPAEAPAE